jgi:hypothetical protein
MTEDQNHVLFGFRPGFLVLIFGLGFFCSPRRLAPSPGEAFPSIVSFLPFVSPLFLLQLKTMFSFVSEISNLLRLLTKKTHHSFFYADYKSTYFLYKKWRVFS